MFFENEIGDIFSYQAWVNLYVLCLSRAYRIPIDILVADERSKVWDSKKRYFKEVSQDKVTQNHLTSKFNKAVKEVLFREDDTHYSFSIFNKHFLLQVDKVVEEEIFIILGPFHKEEIRPSRFILQKCILKLKKSHSQKTGKEIHTSIDKMLRSDGFYRHSLIYWAKKNGYDSSYFSRQFKLYIGYSYSQYREKYRIEYAKNELLMTQLSIEEISNSLGYYDSSHFYNRFLKEEGISPTSFRTENK